MKKTRVAINGFGRIGRAFLRVAQAKPELEIVAINDLTDIENLAYLLKYDTAQGTAPFDVAVEREGDQPFFVVDGKKIHSLSERDPKALPWAEHDIDIVVESTGFFASYEGSQAHLQAGAKRVVISAPVKDEPVGGVNGATVLMGVNQETLATCDISSNASCTTNAGSPVVTILDEVVGIEKAMLNTVHGYTGTQALVDGPDKKDFRRGRAAAQNMVPTSTGAAIATTKALPSLQGKFDGIAVRVPVITGSLVDITFLAKRATTVEEVNELLTAAANDERWNKTFGVTREPLVSSDIIGTRYASIADLALTRVVDGDLVKVLSWYDNEMGYVYSLVEHVVVSGEHIKN